LIGKFHPGVVVEDAVHFIFFVEVDAGHVIEFEAGSYQYQPIDGFFGSVAHDGFQNVSIPVQIAINFLGFRFGRFPLAIVIVVFTLRRAKLFIHSPGEGLLAIFAGLFHRMFF
jgi:hypothetical protein